MLTMLKSIRVMMIVILLALACGIAILYWARQTGRFTPLGGTQFPPSSKLYRVGAPFELVSHLNEPISHRDMEGYPFVAFFGFTSCPEVCPTTLFDIDRWLRQVDPSGEVLNAYFITVDPERDGPEVLNSYINYFSDRITGITGEEEAVWKLADAWNVYHEKRPYGDSPDDGYDINHTASIFLVDADGHFRGTISWGESDRIAVEKLQNLL